MEHTELVKEVVGLSRKTIRGMRLQGSDAWMHLNLTIPQLKSLIFMIDNGDCNFKKLASALKVTPSNLTGVIDRLVEQGLVTRAENPDDRRVILLNATRKGEALIVGLRERRTNHLSKALDNLTDDELETVAKGLSILTRSLESHLCNS
jgi:MarR family transcriptional regulator, organic hydroperoxide resistance regulator